MSNLEDSGSHEKWGDKTVVRNFRNLENKLSKNEKELAEANEHVKTVAELKVVFKWLKIIAVTLTTFIGAIMALKTLEIF